MHQVFVRTRHVYDSYQDLWRLVELSGIETCYVDELRFDRDVLYVCATINGEIRPHIVNERKRCGAGVRARTAAWALERPDAPSAPPWEAEVTDLLRFFDIVWVSDQTLQALDPRTRFVPFGSHAGLGSSSKREMAYDVAFMGYMIPRRDSIAAQLRAHGLRVAPNGWGAERDTILRSTRLMLNVHQHERPMPVGEPLRFALAAAYQLPLVSELVERPAPLTNGYDVLLRTYDELVSAVRVVLSDATECSRLGGNLHGTLCQLHPFGVELARVGAAS